MIKERIARSFDRSATSYDKAAGLQRECADKLISMMQKNIECAPTSMLDIGTGTGYLAEGLSGLYPNANLTINDISPKMLNAAFLSVSPKIVEVILGDMDEERNFGAYDLVASNLALQWSDNIVATIKNFAEKAKYVAFTCLLDGSFKEWQETVESLSLSKPLYDYPTKGDLETSLSAVGIIDSTILEFNLPFDRPKEVVKYFQDLGAITNKKSFSIKEMRKMMNVNIKQNLNYKVFFCILKGKG
jgi:malonyl-CoA O-methyltransferase